MSISTGDESGQGGSGRHPPIHEPETVIQNVFPGAPAAAVSPSLFQDLHWRLVGPFRAGRVLAVSGVPGEPDHFYVGSVTAACGRASTRDGPGARSLTISRPDLSAPSPDARAGLVKLEPIAALNDKLRAAGADPIEPGS